jgi:hypothetical protein
VYLELEALEANVPQTRGFGVGILRQFKLPSGITEHSGEGFCIFLPGIQLSVKSKPILKSLVHSWLNPEKKL